MLTDPLFNEKETLLRVAAGDEDAFTALFLHYQGRVNAIAFTLTRSETAAEELVQDIFLKIWLHRSDLPEVKYFQDYLFIITRNQAFTALKRLASQKKLHQDATADIEFSDQRTEQEVLERDFGKLLEQAIARLPSQQQRVFRLSREQGLNRDEIAEKLRLSPNTVKTHMSQALKNIRAFCIARLDPLC